MRQIRYNENNLSLFFFTPFVVTEKQSDCIVLIHTLTERHVCLKGKEQDLQKICEALKNGVSENELVELLSSLNNYNVEMMDFLIQEGVIE